MNCYSNCLLCFKLFQGTSLKQSTIILGLLFCRISLTLLLYKNLHLLLSFPARQISLSPKAFCCLTELKLSNAPKQKISAKNPGQLLASFEATKNLISYDLQVESCKGPFWKGLFLLLASSLFMQGQNLN